MRITDASQATERAVAAGFAAMRPGLTERALASAIIEAMFDAGAQVVRHAVVTVGDNARHAHPFPSAEKRLDAGDIIRVDVGGLFGGYGSDIARMAVVGAPSAAQAELYQNGARLRARASVTLLKPGMRASDAYRAAVAFYAAAGIPDYRRDHVGHSLSILGGHDNPMLHERNPQPLEAGMVMALGQPILRDAEGRRFTVEETRSRSAPQGTHAADHGDGHDRHGGDPRGGRSLAQLRDSAAGDDPAFAGDRAGHHLRGAAAHRRPRGNLSRHLPYARAGGGRRRARNCI